MADHSVLCMSCEARLKKCDKIWVCSTCSRSIHVKCLPHDNPGEKENYTCKPCMHDMFPFVLIDHEVEFKALFDDKMSVLNNMMVDAKFFEGINDERGDISELDDLDPDKIFFQMLTQI